MFLALIAAASPAPPAKPVKIVIRHTKAEAPKVLKPMVVVIKR